MERIRPEGFRMKRWRWHFLILLICLPVALLATGWRVPFLGGENPGARVLAVPAGDQELAWLHTTTSTNAWERFVFGMVRAQMDVPGLEVDDSGAFRDSSTDVPELALSMAGRPGRVLIRWYKLRSDAGVAEWVNALASRRPAPVGIIGGGSTDRAVELALALDARTEWRGDRPALLITTATADRVAPQDNPLGAPPLLVDLYANRSFRFCFTNRQMADAVLDFIARNPELKPQLFTDAARAGVLSGMYFARPVGNWKPNVFSVQWNDDPYSTDLHEQFKESLLDRSNPNPFDEPTFDFARWDIPFSIGGFNKANSYESRTAESIARQILEMPSQRSLLILPAVTQPARRLLNAIVEAYSGARRRLVVVTGDGIPVNAMLRDGEFAWPMAQLGVPVVFFTHANPVGWDADPRKAPAGYALAPPNSTEEAAHFREMGRIVALACFPPGAPPANRGNALVENLRSLKPAFFDGKGERLGGSGEHVVVALPRYRGSADEIEIWKRNAEGRWIHLDSIFPAAGGQR
jgi:hypothetical protein